MRRPILLLALAPTVHAKDWPMWGGTPSRNMVAEAKGIDYDEFLKNLKEKGQWHVEVY